MTFRQLEYILEVADHGSISVAARNLMVSQPSLSQTVKSVENEFNITIFDRGSVPLVPTSDGEIFLEKARRMLSTLEELKKALERSAELPSELKIGISDSGALINNRILPDFQETFPNIKLILIERDQYMLERMLESGKLDMMFTMSPYDNPNLDIFPLVDDEFVIALPPEHPAAAHLPEAMPFGQGDSSDLPVIDLKDCRDVRFVLSGKDRLKLAQISALRSAFEPQLGFETDTLRSAVAIAAKMPHGTIVPMLYSKLYDGKDIPIFFRSTDALPTWSFALSLRKNTPLTEPGRRYIQLFVKYIATLGLLKKGLTPEQLDHKLRKR